MSALFRMCVSKYVPKSWVPHIRKHMEQLCNMAVDWDWIICLTWSERVFTMIEDGRLPCGWQDIYPIKDVQ